MSTNDFIAKEPTNDPVPLLIGLVGPSSSGKTYSALRLGTGIAKALGGDIHVIDTEAERARHYRHDFKFKHVNFGAPYSSARYAAAIRAQVKQGAKVVIVDSMSHEHEGQGGYLEFHENELNRMAGDDWKKRNAMNFLAWAKPAAERRALINAITSLNAVMIFCFRAKEKLIIRKGQDPIDGGWMPIGGDEFVFEMTVRALLPPGCNGVPEWRPQRPGEVTVPKRPKQFLDVLRDGEALCEKHGEALALWARGEQGKSLPRQQASASDGPSSDADTAGPFDDSSPDGPAPEPKLTLIGKDGREFSFTPDKWADSLVKAIETKPFDYARSTYDDNRDHIARAHEIAPAAAKRVEVAWRTRERANAEPAK